MTTHDTYANSDGTSAEIELTNGKLTQFVANIIHKPQSTDKRAEKQYETLITQYRALVAGVLRQHETLNQRQLGEILDEVYTDNAGRLASMFLVNQATLDESYLPRANNLKNMPYFLFLREKALVGVEKNAFDEFGMRAKQFDTKKYLKDKEWLDYEFKKEFSGADAEGEIKAFETAFNFFVLQNQNDDIQKEFAKELSQVAPKQTRKHVIAKRSNQSQLLSKTNLLSLANILEKSEMTEYEPTNALSELIVAAANDYLDAVTDKIRETVRHSPNALFLNQASLVNLKESVFREKMNELFQRDPHADLPFQPVPGNILDINKSPEPTSPYEMLLKKEGILTEQNHLDLDVYAEKGKEIDRIFRLTKGEAGQKQMLNFRIKLCCNSILSMNEDIDKDIREYVQNLSRIELKK